MSSAAFYLYLLAVPRSSCTSPNTLENTDRPATKRNEEFSDWPLPSGLWGVAMTEDECPAYQSLGGLAVVARQTTCWRNLSMALWNSSRAALSPATVFMPLPRT